MQQYRNGVPVCRYSEFVPNDCEIWFKEHCRQGSHYKTVYEALFDNAELQGKLRPGRKVIETSTGSAGESFVAEALKRGYGCVVVIPWGVDGARIGAILRANPNTIIERTEGDYVNEFPKVIKGLCRKHRAFFLNHSMGREDETGRATENKITTGALEPIGYELSRQLPRVDFFLAAVGNGSSLLGPARAFRALGGKTKIVAYESVQSGVAFEQHKPGEYKQHYGIKIGTLPRHRVFGTSYPGIDCPHIRIAFEEGLVDETWLVSDRDMDGAYEDHWRKRKKKILHFPETLPRWDDFDLPYGRSTRCGLAVALKIAEREHGKIIVVNAYDWRVEREDC